MHFEQDQGSIYIVVICYIILVTSELSYHSWQIKR